MEQSKTAVCPFCGGVVIYGIGGGAHCTNCWSRGWVDEDGKPIMTDEKIPEELRDGKD